MLPSVLRGHPLRKDYHTKWVKGLQQPKKESDEIDFFHKAKPHPFANKDEVTPLTSVYSEKRKTTLLAELDRDRVYLEQLLTNESKFRSGLLKVIDRFPTKRIVNKRLLRRYSYDVSRNLQSER